MPSVDKEDIKALVAADPLAVYRAANLQLGRESGGVRKCLCPFHKEKTPSFAVFVKDGGYKCFSGNCGKTGSAIDFIKEFEHLTSFPEALRRVQEIYGGSAGCPRPSPPPYSPPPPEEKLECFPIPQSAQLPRAEPPDYGGYQYHDRDGNYVLWKYMKTRSPVWFDGKKLMHKGIPCRPLFNLPALLANKGRKPIIIAEGEAAAWALTEAGFLATTPIGGSTAFAKAEWDDLPTDVAIYLWPDDDEPGRKMMEGVAELLHRRGTKTILIVDTNGMSTFKAKGADAADIPTDSRPAECKRRMEGAHQWNPPAAADTQPPVSQDGDGGESTGGGKKPPKRRRGSEEREQNKLMKKLHDALREMGSNGQLGWDWGEDKIYALGLYEGDMNFLGRIAAHLDAAYDIAVSVNTIAREAMTLAEGYEMNSFEKYVSGLPWDGKNRLDTLASRYIDGLMEPEICDHFFSKWYIAGVIKRCVTDHEVSMPYMPVIVAPEGAGKNRLIVNLWGAKKKTTMSFSQEPRELIIAMRGKCVAEIAEMRGFRKAEDEKIKAFITPDASGDTYRPLYKGTSVQSLRRSVLIGTSNEINFLSSVTGNRRFIPLYTECGADTIRYADAEKEREQLMAEAYHRFIAKGDAACHTDKEKWARVSEMNQRFIVITPINGLVLKWLVKEATITESIKPDDCLAYLSDRSHLPRSDLTMKHVRQALASFGWRRSKSRAGGESIEIWKPTARWEEVKKANPLTESVSDWEKPPPGN